MITVERLREKLEKDEKNIFVEDIISFEEAEKAATLATEITGNKYLAANDGPYNCCFGIFKAPKQHDCFGPDGTIYNTYYDRCYYENLLLSQIPDSFGFVKNIPPPKYRIKYISPDYEEIQAGIGFVCYRVNKTRVWKNIPLTLKV